MTDAATEAMPKILGRKTEEHVPSRVAGCFQTVGSDLEP